jgi:hypothetical protein
MDPYRLEIDNPLATCGHCRFTTALTGKWSVEDGRLVFRAALNPLTRRGPGLEGCSESDPAIHFGHIAVDSDPLTDEQVAELRAAARSEEAWREEEQA